MSWMTIGLWLCLCLIGWFNIHAAVYDVDNPGLFIVGIIWISFHALLLLIVGKIFKVPFFYYGVGSMANVGGVASASVISAAFHPSLISVGVILSVFSYAIGTYAGWLTALLMKIASGM